MRGFLSRVWARYSSAGPVTVAALAVVLGLVFGAVIIIATTPAILDAWRGLFHSWGAPGHAIKVTFDNVASAYRSIFTGSIVDPSQFWHSVTTGQNWTASLTPLSETFTYAAPLVIAGIAVGITFQTGLFNIGANGQAILGAVAGVAVASLIHLPEVVHLPLTLLAGMVGGAVGGAIPGLLKAFTGAHEVIVTLMFNYVASFFMLYCLMSTALELPRQYNSISRTMDRSAQLAPLFGTSSGLRVNYGVVVAALVVAFAWWLLERSTLGFEFRVTGANPNAARASGINARRVMITAFIISGALAGLAGIAWIGGTTHYIDQATLQGSAGIGFTAITVALLGRNRPFGIVWGSLLFAALEVGGTNMQANTGIPYDLATVIQAAIVIFVATPVMVKEIYRLRAVRSERIQLATAGWGS